MQFSAFVFILVLAIAGGKIIPLPIEPGAVNVLLIYTQTPTVEYYVRSEQAMATYSAIDGFNIVDSEIGDGTVFLQYYNNSRYWQVRSTDSKLILGTGATDRTPLLLVPTAEGSDRFFVAYNGVPLVAFQSTPPIDFYLQTRYPSEPPATYRFIREFDVEGSYANTRGNIIRTANLISVSTTTDKAEDYKRLIALMAANEHFSGEEVFYVAYRIREDIGAQSEAYRALPGQVQLLAASPELGLKWYNTGRTGNLSIPMKYVSADEAHLNPLPYNFFYMPSNQTWTITYADIHKIYVEESGYFYMLERTDGVHEYRLHLSMHTDLQQFAVIARVIPSSTAYWYPLYSITTTAPITFQARNGYYDYFYVEPY